MKIYMVSLLHRATINNNSKTLCVDYNLYEPNVVIAVLHN